MKDFLDIIVLAETREFGGGTLRLAVAASYAGRKTAIPGDCPLALTWEFSDGSRKKTRWNAFVRGARRTDFREFSEVLGTLARFLWPVLQAASRDEPWPQTWSAGGPWKPRP
jgi:hypothetical protein